MKPATITILSQPDGRWHWVLRLWEKPDGPTIIAAKTPSATAAAAFTDAYDEYVTRAR
jgi:hypothetical protein